MCYTGRCPYENHRTGDCTRSGWKPYDAACVEMEENVQQEVEEGEDNGEDE